MAMEQYDYAAKLNAATVQQGAVLGGVYRGDQIVGEGRGPGPVDRLMASLNMLEAAASATGETADRLCGSALSATKESTQEPLAAGLFGSVHVASARIERMASLILDNMNRINRVAG